MTVLPTSLVGSYPQPDWLIDREALASHVPARVRARDLWRVDERWLGEAQDDATLLAIRDQERAGLPSWPPARSGRSRSRPPSRTSTSACSTRWPARR
ncbi:MAG: hypothetical protein ACXVFL_18500, partial [Solirubrobacteraceae bacterium]